jgi:hypothetical protein
MNNNFGNLWLISQDKLQFSPITRIYWHSQVHFESLAKFLKKGGSVAAFWLGGQGGWYNTQDSSHLLITPSSSPAKSPPPFFG